MGAQEEQGLKQTCHFLQFLAELGHLLAQASDL